MQLFGRIVQKIRERARSEQQEYSEERKSRMAGLKIMQQKKPTQQKSATLLEKKQKNLWVFKMLREMLMYTTTPNENW